MSMTHDEMVQAIRDDEDGCAMQWSPKSCARWRDRTCKKNMDFYDNDYRRKPSPEYRPWTIAEVPVGEILISKNPTNPYRSVIVQENGAMVWVGARLSPYTMAGLMESFTLEDGTPCGVLEGGDQ